MSPLRSVGILFADLAQLFDRKHARLWFLLTAAILLQAGFWYVASPGPALMAFQPRTLLTGVTTVAWSLVFLLAVPMLLLMIVGVDLRHVRLRIGDARFGFAAALAGVVIAVPLMYVGSFDKGLEATYPWAGAWVGRSLGTVVAWALIYGLYYIAFEFFYRGFLQRVVADAWGAPQGVWVQTIAATLIHLGKPMTEVIAALPASLLFGLIALRSRSILASTIIHLAIGLSIDLFVLAHQGLLHV
ncbi:MAG TPA: CPBP family intramembrane glutamic endopeptidase [Trueperaceae bacterium]|nr:CPBP family intramembrane glutamic endopeptidase [Trueperaceae bacterium]